MTVVLIFLIQRNINCNAYHGLHFLNSRKNNYMDVIRTL